MQVLKEDIKKRIHDAALDVFYEKDYKSATMREISERANIPTGLIYSYYKNKQSLFDEIVQPVILKLPDTLKEAEKTPGHAFDKFINIEKKCILDMFDKRRELIVLIDKSAGTRHGSAKEDMIHLIEEHIKVGIKNKNGKEYDDLFAHILASNFTESLLEIARHYKSREWAVEMLDLMSRHYFLGSASL